MSAAIPPRPPDPTQPHAGPSSSPSPHPHPHPQPPPPPRNPQLGPEPWFAYPTPTAEQLEEELPPYLEEENVPMGLLLNRLARKGYGDLRVLVVETLPPLPVRHKPKHVVEYAKTTRQSLLKYLAVLRWKTSVDLPSTSTHPHPPYPLSHQHAPPQPPANAPLQTSTPRSNGESPPGPYPGKGKARMPAGVAPGEETQRRRGKVTDAKRITHFMEHQNSQHESAIGHIRHIARMIEGLRERNPDLLTAISLLTEGDYTRYPQDLLESFVAGPPLTNGTVLRTLQSLNRQILYRLRCVDHVPPEMAIERVADGRVYVTGGGAEGEGGWKASLTLVAGPDDVGGSARKSRWWLTGVEWGWAEKDGDVERVGRMRKKWSEEERQQILDLANVDVLPSREVVLDTTMDGRTRSGGPAIERDGTPGTNQASTRAVEVAKAPEGKVDAPLVRAYNFLSHLSLSYQLEVLCAQAMALGQGEWRGQLLVEMDRSNKVLRLRYWVRPRPAATQQATQAAVGKRPGLMHNLGAQRPPLYGGALTFSLVEVNDSPSETDLILRGVDDDGFDHEPAERVLKLEIGVRWQVGEVGIGGGLKAGETMDSSVLKLDASALSLEDVLTTVTRLHASHLTRHQTAPLLVAPRVAFFPLDPPSLMDSDTPARPLSLRIPLPSRRRDDYLLVSVSARTGLVDITDSGAKPSFTASASDTPDRGARARMATSSINDKQGSLLENVSRLITAIIAETLESQMRQLGWLPARRLPLRSQDLAKHDLHPASCVGVVLPSSGQHGMHYFLARVTGKDGVVFELLRMKRGEQGRLEVGEKMVLDGERLRARKREKEGKAIPGSVPTVELARSGFEVDTNDLKDLYIFANALVAQTIIEQQLKDRSIPYSTQFPPTTGPHAPFSSSPVAGMVPTLVVNSADLLKDGRAADVAMPKVYMQIRDWWKGGTCQVVTLIQLRHKPSFSSHASPSPFPPPTSSASEPSSSPTTDGIAFDSATSTLRFTSASITTCLPRLLDQWERLSKVIVVAGEVSKLNKTREFRDDLRMLSFDLRTAAFIYAAGGYLANITYSPISDSYEVSFARHLVGDDGGGDSAAGSHHNPHEKMASLMSHRLNELTSSGSGSGSVSTTKTPSVGKAFISLLRATLPFLLEADAVGPALVVRGCERYRLVWDRRGKRYAVDVALARRRCSPLVAGAELSYVLTDGSRTEGDYSCGVISEIGGFDQAVDRAWRMLCAKAAAIAIDKSPEDSGANVKVEEECDAAGGGKGPELDREKRSSSSSSGVWGMKVDGGRGLVCSVEGIRDVVRTIVDQVDEMLGK